MGRAISMTTNQESEVVMFGTTLRDPAALA